MSYELVPIPGMDYTRKNFAYLKNHSKNVAFNVSNKPIIPLHDRFQLMERGYYLKYTPNTDQKEEDPERSVKLTI